MILTMALLRHLAMEWWDIGIQIKQVNSKQMFQSSLHCYEQTLDKHCIIAGE